MFLVFGYFIWHFQVKCVVPVGIYCQTNGFTILAQNSRNSENRNVNRFYGSTKSQPDHTIMYLSIISTVHCSYVYMIQQ